MAVFESSHRIELKPHQKKYKVLGIKSSGKYRHGGYLVTYHQVGRIFILGTLGPYSSIAFTVRGAHAKLRRKVFDQYP